MNDCPRCPKLERENEALRIDLDNANVDLTAKRREVTRLKGLVGERKATDNAQVRDVLDYWQAAYPEHRSKLVTPGKARYQRVASAIAAGCTVEDCKRAVDGSKGSPWHQGRNKDRKQLTDVQHIFSNETMVERLRDLALGKTGYQGPRGVQAVLSRLAEVKREGEGRWVGLCPGHDDHNASLSVRQVDDRVLVACRVGCSTEDVMRVLGLPMAALFDDVPISAPPVAISPVLPSLGQLQAWHRGLLASEAVLDRVRAVKGWDVPTLRFFGIGWNPAEKRLTIPAFGPEAELRGVLRYRPKDPDKMLVAKGSKRDLFPLPEFIAKRWVLLAEGEPDAVSGRQHGLPTIAIPGVGYAKNVEKWAPRLKDRKVAVCFDCDDPGREAAERVGHGLAGVARDVRVVDLDASRSDGWDLSDALVGGVSARELCDQVRSSSAVVRWAA